MRRTFQDQLAAIRTREGQRSAERAATREQNEAKKRFGRIFQSEHTTLRLAQRELDIDREGVRPRLLDILGDRAVLYYRKTNVFIPIVRQRKTNRADDWFCITVYQVDSVEEAKRKAARDGSELIVI
ncbi:MAG: hypothetical protein OXH04_22305 [Acidobacteria bacterium]|nr:hypothetical protein [Acidobacteriota bacterium]